MRSDYEFAHGDEKSPLFLCGLKAAKVLKAAGLRGLELRPVVG